MENNNQQSKQIGDGKDNNNTMSQQQQQQTTVATPYKNEGPTAFQLTIAALVLGTSAGFTMYTKKTASMIRTMNQVNENVLRNRPPHFGPPTKQEWEKLRPRIDRDEFI